MKNNPVYIVSYDLSEPGPRYDDLISRIKESPAWARLGDSAYLVVESEKSAVSLRDYYKQALDSNDKLYVGQVSAPAAWYNMPQDVSEWIHKQLKSE